MYNKILVAMDVYEDSEKLQNKVKDYIEHGSEVYLCTAVLPLENMYSYSPVGGYSIVVNGFLSELRENSKVRLVDIAKKLGLKEEQAYVLDGKAGGVVHSLAKKLEADLILVGSHGKGKVRSMLGSTSRSIVAGAPCDVLVMTYN